jgi:hypothetical protein
MPREVYGACIGRCWRSLAQDPPDELSTDCQAVHLVQDERLMGRTAPDASCAYSIQVVGRCRVCRARGAQQPHGHLSRDSLREKARAPLAAGCRKHAPAVHRDWSLSTVSPGEVQALRGSGWMLTVSACPRLGCKSNSGSTQPSRSGPQPGHRYRRKSGTGDPVDDPAHADRRPGTSLAACDTLGAVTACARAQFECYREDP